MELYCNLALAFGKFCTEYVGDVDGDMLILPESPLGYHAKFIEILTFILIEYRDIVRRAV